MKSTNTKARTAFEPLPAAPAPTGSTLLPAQPAPPGPANTGTDYEQHESWTLAAGAYLHMNNGSDRILNHWVPTVTNHGSIYLSMTGIQYGTLRVSIRPETVVNSGTIVAVGQSEYVTGIVLFSESTNATNSGTMLGYAYSPHSSAQIFKSFALDATVINSGLLGAYSELSIAMTVHLVNRGKVTNLKDGRIFAEGHSATAILVEHGPTDGGYAVDNAGLIEARSIPGGLLSAGVWVSDWGAVRNTGTIRGDIGVEMSGTLTNSGLIEGLYGVIGGSMLTIENEAAGIIRGAVIGGEEKDTINNRGLIAGNMILGLGNDEVRNIGAGSVTGIVDLGFGDDLYLGGSGQDRVAGDNGKDHIEGLGGDDLLIGGNDDDELIGGAGADGLYGERGNDRLVLQGRDHADGGHGDDRIALSDYGFAFAAGGGGSDTLVLAEGARNLSLAAAIASGRIAGIEAVELRGGQQIAVGAADVAALSDSGAQLRIEAGATDKVHLVGAWTAGADVTVGDAVYKSYTLETRTVLVRTGAQVATAATAPSGFTGLDAIAGGAAAPKPGEDSGLHLTPDEIMVTYLELNGRHQIYEGETWYTLGDAPAVYSYRSETLLVIDGALLAFNADEAMAIAVEFTNLTYVENNGLISAVSTGAVVNDLPDHFPAVREGAFAVHNAFSVINTGIIEAHSAHGMAGALGDALVHPVDQSYDHETFNFKGTVAQLDNKGLITALAEDGYALGAVSVLNLKNAGDILVEGSDGATAALVVQSVVNSGTIEAVSGSIPSTGIVFLWGDTPYVLQNSGRISADVAIRVMDYYYSPGFAIDVTNSGLIEGTIIFGGTDDVYDGTAGEHKGQLHAGGGADRLTGGAHADAFHGGDGNDTLIGGGGNDLLDGGGGIDVLKGGFGDDYYLVDSASDALTEAADAGTDTVESNVTFTLAANIEHLVLTGAAALAGTGNNSANRITGNNAANTLKGGGGDDRLDGGAGADSMSGGAGDDLFIVDNAADTVLEAAGGGIDRVEASVSWTMGQEVENLTLTGISAVDATGNALANLIAGNAAANRLDGGAGADSLAGGKGDDIYVVDDQGDIVVEAAGGGKDLVLSSVGFTLGLAVENLTLTSAAAIDGTGNEAANYLTGNAAANVLDGAGGDDVLDGGGGSDRMIGGDGNDIYLVDRATDMVVEASATGGIDLVRSAASLTLSTYVEKLVLTGTSDLNGTGNALANTITGNAGKNVLDGAAGADAMFGGDGNDIYVVDNALDKVVDTAGTDLVRSSIDHALGADIEKLTLTGTGDRNGTGNGAANALTGNAGKNVLDGKAGADAMNGGDGNDVYVVDNAGDTVIETSATGGTDLVKSLVSFELGTNVEKLTLTGTADTTATGNALANVLVGNNGANILKAGAGNDLLDGGADDDRLYGGAGMDTLTGGTGKDRFYFDSALDKTANVDKILDFAAADDSLYLSRTIFSGMAAGAVAAGAFVAGTAAADADDRIIYNAATGSILFDADGNGAGAAILFARVESETLLSNADFIVF